MSGGSAGAGDSPNLTTLMCQDGIGGRGRGGVRSGRREDSSSAARRLFVAAFCLRAPLPPIPVTAVTMVHDSADHRRHGIDQDQNNNPNKMSSPLKRRRAGDKKKQTADADASDDALFLPNGCGDFSDNISSGNGPKRCANAREFDGSDSCDSGVAEAQSEDRSLSPEAGPHAPLSKKQRKLVLEKATQDNRAIVVALQKPAAIGRRIDSAGLSCGQPFPLTLSGLGLANKRAYERNQRLAKQKKSKRHGSDSEESDDESDGSTPEGEWEVKEIKDWGLDDEGKIKYLVHWKGWDGADTWEPAENLSNAVLAVKTFLQLRQTQESVQMRRTLRDLRLLVEKLVSEDGDVGLLFRLFRYKPDYDQNVQKKISELRQTLQKKSKLLREFKQEEGADLTAQGVIDLVTKELNLTNSFEAVKELLDLADERKESLRKLKKREVELQQVIRDQGDSYIITMENLVDTELPKKFEYIKHYFYFDVEKPLDPVIYCTPPTGKDKHTCDKKGCMLDKGRCPCVKESGRVPYEKDGVLKLDAREPIYECNSKCVCVDSCRFRVVSRGCGYSFCIFKTDGERGWGLRAMERIPKGKFITTYNGEVVSYREKNRRDKTMEEWKTTYMFDLDYNPEENDAEILAVDARFKGNLARFINHCCTPNLQINPCWNENQDRRMPLIAFFTNRIISKGEELTIDYDARSGEVAEQNKDLLQMIDPAELGDPHNATRLCHCGAATCRGFIM